MKNRLSLWLLPFMLCCWLLFAMQLTFAKQKITVFAAASLTNALQDIATQYQQQHDDVQIDLSFASSSVLARQIVYGAPADIFMSADLQWMDYLQQQDLLDQQHHNIL